RGGRDPRRAAHPATPGGQRGTHRDRRADEFLLLVRPARHRRPHRSGLSLRGHPRPRGSRVAPRRSVAKENPSPMRTAKSIEGAPPRVAPELLLRLYREMLRLRTLDERMMTLQRQGRVGFYGACTGQEAATIASRSEERRGGKGRRSCVSSEREIGG